MTPEAQRIAIAEACGWKAVVPQRWSGYTETYQELCSPANSIAAPAQYFGYVPDYPNDLNAMHMAEKVLFTEFQCSYYAVRIAELVKGFPHDPFLGPQNYMWHATAAQRAEAFLRTIGKWVD